MKLLPIIILAACAHAAPPFPQKCEFLDDRMDSSKVEWDKSGTPLRWETNAGNLCEASGKNGRWCQLKPYENWDLANCLKALIKEKK